MSKGMRRLAIAPLLFSLISCSLLNNFPQKTNYRSCGVGFSQRESQSPKLGNLSYSPPALTKEQPSHLPSQETQQKIFRQFVLWKSPIAATNLEVKHTLAQTITTPDRKGEGDKLYQQGMQEFRRGEYAKALQTYQRVLEIRRQLGDKAAIGDTLDKVGLVYNGLFQHDKALEFLQEALKIRKELKDGKGEGDTLDNIGAAYLGLEKNEIAIEKLQQALTIRRQEKDRAGEGITLSRLGLAYSTAKQYDQGLQFLQQALAIHQEVGDRFQEGFTLFRIGQAYLNTNNVSDYPRALEWFNKALTLNKEVGNLTLEGKSLEVIAIIYTAQNKIDQALKLYQEALPLIKTSGNRVFENNIVSKIENIYINKQQYDQLCKFFQQELSAAKKAKDKQQQSFYLYKIANLYQKMGEFEEAMRFYEEGLKITQELPNETIGQKFFKKNTEGLMLSAISNSYLLQQKYDDSIKYGQLSLDRYLAIAKDIQKLPNQILHLNNFISILTAHVQLSISYNNKKNYSSAISEANHVIHLVPEALKIARELKQPVLEKQIMEEYSTAYSQLSASYLGLEDLDKSEEFGKKSLKIARQIEDLQTETEAILTLSNILIETGNYAKSIDYLERLIEIDKQLKGQALDFKSLALIGVNYANLGDFDKSIDFLKQAYKKTEDTSKTTFPELALLLKSYQLATLGHNYTEVGEEEEALKFAQQTLELSQSLKYTERKSELLLNLSDLYTKLQDFQKAFQLNKEALSKIQQSNNTDLEIQALIGLGGKYSQIGDYEQASKYIKIALEKINAGKDKRINKKLQALSILYDIANAQGNFQEAKKILEEMLTEAKQNKRTYTEMKILGSLSSFYMNLGDYQKSIDYSQQAVSAAQKLQHPQIEAASLFSIALSYFHKGEPKKTIEFAELGLVISKKYRMLRTEFFANAVLSLGYGALGNDQKAMEAAQANLVLAKKTKNPQIQQIALQILGLVHNKFGRKQEAIQAYLGALSVKIAANQVGQNAGIYSGLARAYADNQPTTAIAYYKKSIDEFEQIRRGIKGLSQQYQDSFLNGTIDFDRRKVSDVYRELTDLLLSQGREKEALQVRDLLGTQEIREFVAARGARGEQAQIPLTDSEKKIQSGGESIVALGRQISECDHTNCSQKTELNNKLQTLTEEFTKELQKIEQEIRETRQKDDAFFDPRNKAKIREIVESKPGTVMIYPLVMENRLWLLMYSEGDVVKKQEIPVKREELGKAVLEFRQLMEKCEKRAYCGGEEIPKVQATSQKLYNWLIKPLEAELKANPVKNIVFALDRVTRYVPMSALFDGKQYLIEKYTIYNVLSADLTDMHKPLPTGIENTPVLAMGLSNSGNTKGFSFPGLPNVPKELNAIVRNNTNKQGIYPGLEFLNNAFDFNALRDNLTGHKILHLATHGKFVPNDKDGSFLVSGKYQPIQLSEINSLRGLSGIHLVVLSACETALAGPYQDGVEINTLAHYFINNGAKAVISSLWQVADETTSLLMQRFYSNLAKDGKLNASPRTAEALRQAQLSLLHGNNSTTGDSEKRGGIIASPVENIKPGTPSSNEQSNSSYSHPYYWAPFILIGNGL